MVQQNLHNVMKWYQMRSWHVLSLGWFHSSMVSLFFFYLPVWETIRIATFSPGQRPPQMTMAEQDIASCAKNVGLWMGVVIFCRMTACWSLLQFEFLGASLCMKQCWRQYIYIYIYCYRLMPSTHTPETSGRCLPFPPCWCISIRLNDLDHECVQKIQRTGDSRVICHIMLLLNIFHFRFWNKYWTVLNWYICIHLLTQTSQPRPVVISLSMSCGLKCSTPRGPARSLSRNTRVSTPMWAQSCQSRRSSHWSKNTQLHSDGQTGQPCSW